MAAPTPTRLDALHVGDEPAAWSAAGFTVATEHGGTGEVALGGVRLHLTGASGGRGITGWSLTPPAGDVDGLRALPGGRHPDAAPDANPDAAPDANPDAAQDANPDADEGAATGSASPHPNRVVGLDHLVIITPDLERTSTALAGQGWVARRTLAQPGLARTLRFFVVPTPGGRTVLEVVQPDDRGAVDRPARFWGMALVCEDLDWTCERLGSEVISDPRPAVQPDRRIATVRGRSLGISVPLALLSPRR